MSGKKPLILLFCDYYLPGYKSGGGMRTIVNMVERLGEKYDFRIVTRDHDGKKDRKQYEDVLIGEWNQIGKAQVFYVPKKNIRLPFLKKLILQVKPEVIYTNSLLSTLAIYVLKIRKLGVIDNVPFVIAPCGELSYGALNLKRSKKRLFFKYAGLIRLYRDIIWKASSQLEAEEVQRMRPKNAEIMIAPDLPAESLFDEYDESQKPNKKPGEVKLVFLSRFEKKKNLNWVLPILKELKGEVSLDIIGPIQDEEYYRQAERLVRDLPENISVEFLGPVPHEEVCSRLLDYHFFICPTLGENFGHIFLEAMAAGCPLIISDRTPWRTLTERGIGWDIPLESPAEWKAVLQETVEMGGDSYKELSRKAKSFVSEWLKSPVLDKETEEVLERALGRKRYTSSSTLS